MEIIFYIIKNGSSITRAYLVTCASAVCKPLLRSENIKTSCILISFLKYKVSKKAVPSYLMKSVFCFLQIISPSLSYI